MAVKTFDLMNDKTIVSLQKMSRAQKEQEQKDEFEKASPTPEVLKELAARGKALGTPQYKQDGTMTFDFFLETMKIATEFTMRQTFAGLEEFKIARRAALKEGNQEEYQQQILKAANWE